MRGYLRSVIIVISAIAGGSNVGAAVLGTYSFDGEVLTPSAVAANITLSDFQYSGTGSTSFPAGYSSTDSLSASRWPSDATQSNRFFFSVAVDAGYQLDLSAVVFDHKRSGTGPTSYEVFVAGSTLGTASVGDIDDWQAGEVFGPGAAGLTASFDVDIFASNAERSAGTWRVDNIVLHGAVAPAGIAAIPETSSIAIWGLGGIVCTSGWWWRRKRLAKPRCC